MPLPPIKESMQKAIDDPEVHDWADCTVRAAFRLALAEIERLETFRRDAVAMAAAALDSRSHSRCVYALEEIFRKGSRS